MYNSHLLPVAEVRHENLVHRVIEQQDFIATRMELLDEQRLGQFPRALTDSSQEENLSLALLPVLNVLLKAFVSTRISRI